MLISNRRVAKRGKLAGVATSVMVYPTGFVQAKVVLLGAVQISLRAALDPKGSGDVA